MRTDGVLPPLAAGRFLAIVAGLGRLRRDSLIAEFDDRVAISGKTSSDTMPAPTSATASCSSRRPSSTATSVIATTSGNATRNEGQRAAFRRREVVAIEHERGQPATSRKSAAKPGTRISDDALLEECVEIEVEPGGDEEDRIRNP